MAKNSGHLETYISQNRDPTLHKGLQIADASFKYLWGGREDAQNFLILISGGRSSHPRKTQVRITALEVSLLLTLLLCVSGGKSRYPYLTKVRIIVLKISVLPIPHSITLCLSPSSQISFSAVVSFLDVLISIFHCSNKLA